MNQGSDRRLRLVLAVPLALLLTPALAVGVTSTGISLPLSACLALVVSAIAAFMVVSRFSSGQAPVRFPMWLWCAMTIVAAYFVADLSVFMGDVTRTDHAFDPYLRPLEDERLSEPFYPKHNCFTAYVVAADLAGAGVSNVFETDHYREPDESNPLVEQIATTFRVDRYQYPPPFLILPRALLETGGAFFQIRAWWFAINVTLLVGTLVTLTLWLNSATWHVYWLMLPAVLLAPILRGALQIQNVHVMIIAISLLALPAFDARKNWLGGALLGFAIVSKLFPGLLLVFLFLQRRWRAFAWTLGWMTAFVVLTLFQFGTQPFRAFFEYQMPRLASGEAFSFATTMTAPMLKNASILGVAYKLGLLDLISDPKRVAPFFVWGYSLLLMALLLVVGLRRSGWTLVGSDDQEKRCNRLRLARVWLAILVLGQLRSPFLPWTYGNVPVLLLMVLLLSDRRHWIRNVAVVASFIVLALPIPLPWGPTGVSLDVWFTLVGLTATLVAMATALLERPVQHADATLLTND